MSCEQRPSVTLWGTTQVTTRTTVLSTITRADARRTTSSVTATQCDGDGNCGPVARPTVIVDEADLSFETITTETVLTNVVPVQTRYHECPPDPSLTVEPGTTGEALSAIISQTEISNDSLTVTNAVPAPTSSPSPAPDQSSPPSSSSTATETARSRQTTRSSPSDDETSREPTMSVDFSSFEATRTDDDLSAHTSTLPNGRTSPVTTGTNDSAAGTGSSGLATHSGLSPSEIAGVSIGSVFGAILVLILLLRYRRKRQTRRDNDDDDDPEETYWERRFQEREGGTEKLTDGPATGDSPRDEEGTHHKHFTLNLASHHPIIDRPASRLSQISSFFGGPSGRRSSKSPSPEPTSRFALMCNRHAIDFSRSRDDDGQSSRSFTAAAGAGKTASMKSTRSRSGATEKRTSNWPFMGIAAAIKKPSSVRQPPNGTEGEEEGGGAGAGAGRKGMEWIRTIVSSDSGFGFNKDPGSDSTSPSNGRGLPPPPRSRGVSPLSPHLHGRNITPDPAADRSQTETGNMRMGRGNLPRISAFPDLKPAESISPPPPIYHPDDPAYDDHNHILPTAAAPMDGGGSRQLYPSNSLRRKRQNKGLPVLDIELNKDATSPNLWIDDETLDKFGRCSVVQRERIMRPDPEPDLPPPLPIVPAAAKRQAAPAPSAYNAPELTSRFSPDSSRGSFQQHQQQRRGSDDSVSIDTSSRKDLPLPPPPPPAAVTTTHSTPREQPTSKRFDRSAVTPQLPTLATSNADAFRAEMAELSASTGGSEREERVLSFHESGDRNRDKRW